MQVQKQLIQSTVWRFDQTQTFIAIFTGVQTFFLLNFSDLLVRLELAPVDIGNDQPRAVTGKRQGQNESQVEHVT